MRLLTRTDLDGLASARILRAHESLDAVVLVHPQQITDKSIPVTGEDILVNLPYHPDCGVWFDHHPQTASNERPPATFEGRWAPTPSAAQLVWEHYGAEERFARMVHETNRFDSARLSQDDVLKPRGYILLGFALDPASRLGNDEDFFRHCSTLLDDGDLDRVLLDERVRGRLFRMFEQNEACCWTLTERSRLTENVVFTDLRGVADPPAGNRFLIYTLFPEANVSVQAQWGLDDATAMVKVGHSIFRRTCKTHVGELMSEYGGGGHAGAGSAPLPLMKADRCLHEIIDRLRAAG